MLALGWQGQRSNQLNYVPNLILIVSNVFWAARVPAFWQELAFLRFGKKLWAPF
jgi:hypothetical protein